MRTICRRGLGMVVVAAACGAIACSAPAALSSDAGGSPPVPSAAVSSPSATRPTPSASVPAPTPSPANDAPVAVLIVGADRHAGEVGGFTFGAYSQSAPWLPATALAAVEVPTGLELRVELDDRATIAGWTARLAAASDVTADSVTGVAQGQGSTVAFRAPPTGDWVLSLTITYGQGLGSGAYYWHVVVE